MRASGDASQAAAPRRAGRADVLSARVAGAPLVPIAGAPAPLRPPDPTRGRHTPPTPQGTDGNKQTL